MLVFYSLITIIIIFSDRRNIKIARIAGASAGAWSGLFIILGFGTKRWIETYYGWKERENTTIHEAYDDMVCTSTV